jgi:pimeloyl-ACP methyl ester carboxylesterase
MGGERSAPRPRRYFVDTAQGFVHVQDCGTGERVLVFLSITSFGGVLLDQVLPALARRGYRALAIDLMGYGLSDKRQHDWSIAEFADNVLDAVTLAGVIPVGYVSGHFAGLVGLEIAARAPAGLRAAVLDGLPFLEPDKRVTPESFQPPPPTGWHEDGAHAVTFWKRAWSLLQQLNPDMALPVQPGHKLRAAYLAYLAVACFDPGPAFAFQTFDSERRMADIALPCLLICAQTDWNRKHLERWASGIAGSQTLALPGTHPLHDLVNQERADQYVAIIDDFFASHLK